MNKPRLEYLLKRFHDNRCTEAEMAELDNWFHLLNRGQNHFDELVKQSGGEEELAGEMYAAFQHRLNRDVKKVTTLRLWYRVAAILLVFITAGILVYKYMPAGNKAAQQQVAKSDIAPGTNKAVLTLADGTQILLDSAANGQLASQAGISISKAANGVVTYKIADAGNSDNAAPAYNNIQTPRGGQYQVILPDGSKVWLNASSSLRFPVRFDNNERRVELTGEAYFEVAHNKQKPFKVYSGRQEVKVLGTQFNVKAYTDEATLSTTLFEGSVLINNLQSGQSKILKPGQQARLAAGSETIEVAQVNADQAISWKSGYFVFDNEDITGIMKTISRWYDVDVEYRNVGSAEKFGGAFSRSSNLSEILSNLESLGNVHFKIQGRRIIVSQ